MREGEPRFPWWRVVKRYRMFKVRHMLGEWWIDAWILREGYHPAREPKR